MNIKIPLNELRPDLIEQWHPIKNNDLKIEQFTKGSRQKIWRIQRNTTLYSNKF